ncbi:very short patch repair endonuclease [Burkholderia vietnamiensis]|uniref:very short patch repair endonuclease n=1 Tax=Burkholderia vietnamiensis TaxID=60552 RepID=UPI001CF15C7A|nr:very short patch repair endonuclease [Burkholderia vietnamiensis]MCA8199192.1 very short patch repair endonuclease [Burkholderia vietnamiensis]
MVIFSPSLQRSRIMAAIRSKDTKPEMMVRTLLRQLGFPGYRLHRRDLPGCPDIAYLGRKKAILVHGCFWHGHDCKIGDKRPKVNPEYWMSKISRTRQRDALARAAIEELGWRILIVWECDLRDTATLSETLDKFMRSE